MIQSGRTPADIANACGVDPKTVARWITTGRLPHRVHRWETAKLLDADEVYLWPELLERQAGASPNVELIQLYSNRAAVPGDMWLHLLSKAIQSIDVLVYAGTFFAQIPRISTMLTQRAASGTHIRLCLANPASQAVDVRDREEGLRGTLAAKIRASLTYYTPLLNVPECEIRLHGATVYASIFRFDNVMMVNPHAWGHPASANPLLHLQRVDSFGLFDHYLQSLEGVWETAEQWNPDDWDR